MATATQVLFGDATTQQMATVTYDTITLVMSQATVINRSAQSFLFQATNTLATPLATFSRTLAAGQTVTMPLSLTGQRVVGDDGGACLAFPVGWTTMAQSPAG